MANRKGRPRKTPDLADFKIDADDNAEFEQVVEVQVDADYQPTLHRLTPTATRGGMHRRNENAHGEIAINPRRMAHALTIVGRITNHGGSIQEHNNCITLTLGRYSESINITAPDNELDKLVNRVITAGGQY